MAQDIENAEQLPEGAVAQPSPAAVPEDSLEAAFVKLGGKVVRGATPRQDADPNPDLFQELGGKYVGKIPAAVPPSAKE